MYIEEPRDSFVSCFLREWFVNGLNRGRREHACQRLLEYRKLGTSFLLDHLDRPDLSM